MGRRKRSAIFFINFIKIVFLQIQDAPQIIDGENPSPIAFFNYFVRVAIYGKLTAYFALIGAIALILVGLFLILTAKEKLTPEAIATVRGAHLNAKKQTALRAVARQSRGKPAFC